MSRLAISAKRPFWAVARTVASTKPSLVRLLSTTSTPAAAGVRQDLIGEIRSARVVDVFHTHLAQRRAFVGAGGREDGRAVLLCHLDRGQSDTAAGGVNEHAITGLQLRPVEREPDRQRSCGNGGRRHRAQPVGHRRQQLGRHIDPAGECALHEAEDALADLESGDVGTQLGDDAGEVTADQPGSPG